MNTDLVLKGNIIYSKTPRKPVFHENSFLVSLNGKVEGIYKELPQKFKNIPLKDCGDCLIIPGLTDLHTHAPQYSFRGTGMDLELLEWLNTHVFPEEARYLDPAYARAFYRIFADHLKAGATTRACIFATVHTDSTLILMDLLEETGLKTMVGKVNMDRNSPDYLCESTAEHSVSETLRWLKEVESRHYQFTLPILTPRFIPSCSDELLKQLAGIQKEQHLPLQSHLSENRKEIEWVQELCPESDFYGDAYNRSGLFGSNGKTVMAHCVHSGEKETELMKKNNVFIAHCPESNINLCSGIAPVRHFLDRGLHVGLGSDVAAGTSSNLFRAMAVAIQASKMRCCLSGSESEPLTVPEVFYMATKGGGAFFGKTGSFEPGYETDAVILDDSRIRPLGESSLKTRLERIIYLADEREVVGKYVSGKNILR